MMSQSQSLPTSVAIIGGGVSALTSAILLEANNYRTHIYTTQTPTWGRYESLLPTFATLHAAASIIPHSVASPQMARWFTISQAFFGEILRASPSPGIRTQVHYEIFENPISEFPEYASLIRDFTPLSAAQEGSMWVPKRPKVTEVHGWSFQAYFCEAPKYMRYLYDLYQAVGGVITKVPHDYDLPSYLGLNFTHYVNCTGYAAPGLLASLHKSSAFVDRPQQPDYEAIIDPFATKLIRGHYLRVDVNEDSLGLQGAFSYNYKPIATIYQNTDGTPADVYCYPRSDTWILGGSRQVGIIDENGIWSGETTIGEEIDFPVSDTQTISVPTPILELNSDLLSHFTKGRLNLRRMIHENPASIRPGIGYRFVRDTDKDSVRLSVSRVSATSDGSHKYIFHNYGHGGAGYTLSWGCAYDVLRCLDRFTNRNVTDEGVLGSDLGENNHFSTQNRLRQLTARLIHDYSLSGNSTVT